jgi:hypothetical protein
MSLGSPCRFIDAAVGFPTPTRARKDRVCQEETRATKEQPETRNKQSLRVPLMAQQLSSTAQAACAKSKDSGEPRKTTQTACCQGTRGLKPRSAVKEPGPRRPRRQGNQGLPPSGTAQAAPSRNQGPPPSDTAANHLPNQRNQSRTKTTDRTLSRNQGRHTEPRKPLTLSGTRRPHAKPAARRQGTRGAT